MKKTTKGALAAAASAVLLAGGAGSLAYWTDAEDIAGGSIASGQLDIALISCDSDWTLDEDGGLGGPLAGREIVPGDTLTKACSFTITAEGDHLEGELSVGTPTLTGDDASFIEDLQVTADYTVDRGTAEEATYTSQDAGSAPIDFEDGVYTLDADVTVVFPFDGDTSTAGVVDIDNTTQNAEAALGAITVQLTQTDSH